MSRITSFPRLSRTPLLLLSLGLLLAACGEEQAAPEVIRPAIVVQPDSAGMALTAFSGEMHARREPQQLHGARGQPREAGPGRR